MLTYLNSVFYPSEIFTFSLNACINLLIRWEVGTGVLQLDFYIFELYLSQRHQRRLSKQHTISCVSEVTVTCTVWTLIGLHHSMENGSSYLEGKLLAAMHLVGAWSFIRKAFVDVSWPVRSSSSPLPLLLIHY